MASEVIVRLVDDIDGSEATQTVRFGLNRKRYEIDLNEDHVAELRGVLEPFVEHARTVGARGSRRRATRGVRGARGARAPRATKAAQAAKAANPTQETKTEQSMKLERSTKTSRAAKTVQAAKPTQAKAEAKPPRNSSRATLFSSLDASEKERFRAWAGLPSARRNPDAPIQEWIEAGRP